MPDTTELIVAAGAVGLGWWIYRHEQDRRLEQQHATAKQLVDAKDKTPAPSSGASSSPPHVLPTPKRPASHAPPPKPSAPTTSVPATSAKPTSSSPPPSVPKIATAPAPTDSARARPAGPTQPITRAFDPLFAAYGEAVPVPYLRALAAHESDLHANANDGPGAGLLQVVDIVRVDFNQRHATHFTRADLLVPLVNVQIAADTIRRIIESYRANHPKVPNLREDWRNPRFVELATFGWNAGFSERAGVGRVATALEAMGRTDLTIEVVAATAPLVAASPHLSVPGKIAYAKNVTATYFAELERDERDHVLASPLVAGAPTPPAPHHS